MPKWEIAMDCIELGAQAQWNTADGKRRGKIVRITKAFVDVEEAVGKNRVRFTRRTWGGFEQYGIARNPPVLFIKSCR